MVQKQIKSESIIMPEIIRCMQNLGGKTTRKDIRKEIRDTSEVISEAEVDQTKISKKNKKEYHPFDFRFNFAVKNLILAGYINTEDNRNLELSEKGRVADPKNFDPYKLVWPVVAQEETADNKEEETEEVEDSEESDSWRTKLLSALLGMSPRKFEIFCRALLTHMGVDIDDKIGVQYVADGGLDGFGYITSDTFRTTRVALQAKRWKGNVSSPEIDKFRGAMDKYNAEYGIFITTSDFTRDAIQASRVGTRVITLINGDKICDLVSKYELYVEPVITYKLGQFYKDSE